MESLTNHVRNNLLAQKTFLLNLYNKKVNYMQFFLELISYTTPHDMETILTNISRTLCLFKSYSQFFLPEFVIPFRILEYVKQGSYLSVDNMPRFINLSEFINKYVTIGKQIGKGVQGEVSIINFNGDIRTCKIDTELNRLQSNIESKGISEIYNLSNIQAVIKISNLVDFDLWNCYNTLFTFYNSNTEYSNYWNMDVVNTLKAFNFPINSNSLSQDLSQQLVKIGERITNNITDLTTEVNIEPIISYYLSRAVEMFYTPFHPLLYGSFYAFKDTDLPSSFRLNCPIISRFRIEENSTLTNKLQSIMDKVGSNKPMPCQVTLMEKLDATFGDLMSILPTIFPDINDLIHVYYALSFQVVAGIHIKQYIFHGVSNDRHNNNFMVKNVNHPFIYYVIKKEVIPELIRQRIIDNRYSAFENIDMTQDIYFHVPTFGFVVKEIDMGRAGIVVKNPATNETITISSRIQKRYARSQGYNDYDLFNLNSDLLSFVLNSIPQTLLIYDEDVEPRNRMFINFIEHVLSDYPEKVIDYDLDRVRQIESSRYVLQNVNEYCKEFSLEDVRECKIKWKHFGLSDRNLSIPKIHRAIPKENIKYFGIFATNTRPPQDEVVIYDLFPEITDSFWNNFY